MAGQRLLSSELTAPQADRTGRVAAAHPTLHQGVLEALTSNLPQRVGPWRDDDGRLRLSFIAPLAAETHQPAVVVLHHTPPAHLHHTPPAHLHPTLRDWPVPQQTAEAFLFRPDPMPRCASVCRCRTETS